MIDYMLVQKTVLKNVKDIKIIPGEECFTQHRLLAMDFLLEIDTIKKVKKSERIKLWKLKDNKIKEKVKNMIKETTKESQCWKEWSENILKAAIKICGISKGGHKSKITWWWNDDVKKAIKEKRPAYKSWQKNGDEKSKKQYQGKKKE